MDKRRTHHYWTKLRWIKPWYFLILALISGAICILALRANNQHMIKLREAVYVADQAGSDVQKPLQALQAYVTTHMNTDLNAGNSTVYPPIQLKYTYERLVKQQQDKLNQANLNAYTDAQKYCEQQNSTDFSGRNRVPCIEQYVQAHTSQKPAPIPDALYKFAFTSPTWSPDLAGWSLLLVVISLVLFVITLLGRWWLRSISK